MPATDQINMTHAQWLAEAVRRFGKNPLKWRFVCPVCSTEISVEDYKNAKAPEGAIAFSCIGRYLSMPPRRAFGDGERVDGPCDYTGGGLLQLNPIHVQLDDGTVRQTFEFAPQSPAPSP